MRPVPDIKFAISSSHMRRFQTYRCKHATAFHWRNRATRIMKRHVYFIKPIGMDGPIKIGTSHSPLERIKTFATWSPIPLELIGAVPGSHAEETFLHQRFADLHSHLEWFRSSPLLLRTIRRILDGETFASACEGLPVLGKIPRKARRPPNRNLRIRKFIGKPIHLRGLA